MSKKTIGPRQVVSNIGKKQQTSSGFRDTSGIMTRFDLEQQIYNCWSVIEDLETVYHAEHLYSDENEMQNALLGLISLYNLKFEKLFDVFKKHNGIDEYNKGDSDGD